MIMKRNGMLKNMIDLELHQPSDEKIPDTRTNLDKYIQVKNNNNAPKELTRK